MPAIPSSSPPRGRRLPRAEREAAMLRTAGHRFAARGFHAASMEEIAEAAGISKPMLYNYFGSKEGLYAAYVRSSAQALIRSMREAASPSASAQDRLRAGLLAFLTYAEHHRAGWAVLHNEATAQGDTRDRDDGAPGPPHRHAQPRLQRRRIRPRLRRRHRIPGQLVARSPRASKRPGRRRPHEHRAVEVARRLNGGADPTSPFRCPPLPSSAPGGQQRQADGGFGQSDRGSERVAGATAEGGPG